MKSFIKAFSSRFGCICVLAACFLLLASCSEPSDDGLLASFTISLGDDSRAVLNYPPKTPADYSQLKFTVYFKPVAGGSVKSFTVEKTSTINGKIAPDDYEVTMEVFMRDTGALLATGGALYDPVTIRSGTNRVQVALEKCVNVDPFSVNVAQGGNYTFYARGPGGATLTVTWSVNYQDGTPPTTGTNIDISGRLSISPSEDVGTVLVVTASEAGSPVRVGTATATVFPSSAASITGTVVISAAEDFVNGFYPISIITLPPPSSPGAQTFKWLRNGIDTGVTDNTYSITYADYGAVITLKVEDAAYTGFLSDSVPIQELVGIYDETQLADIKKYNNYNHRLEAPIILSTDWIPIDKFKANFDGNGKTITNLTINSSSGNLGLFGTLEAGAKVEKLGLGINSITGKEDIGGIAGLNKGTVENCYVFDSTGTDTALIKGTHSIGGIVGSNDGGTVQNCYSTVAIEATERSAGGIVGNYIGGSIIACVALNPSVKLTANSNANADKIGCVFGFENTAPTTGTNNYSRDDMALESMVGGVSSPVSKVFALPLKDGDYVSFPDWNYFIIWSSYPLSWDFTSTWMMAGTPPLPIIQ